MNTSSRPVVIAVAVTNRSAAFRRLLDSLRPVASDPELVFVVLDNCSSEDERAALRASMEDWREGAMGSAHLIASPEPGGPLHRSRQALTQGVSELFEEAHIKPIVWVIDDDLTFERLSRNGRTLRLDNVSRCHMETVRRWRRDTRLQVVIGDFTGDPPIRPEAVLATQLGDLAHNLRVAAAQPPSSSWSSNDEGGDWLGDYFYDHAEHRRSHLRQRYGWLCRAGMPTTVRAQFGAMCREACRIVEGGTPFRPKLTHGPAILCENTTSPRRGGNTLFFDFDAFLAHTYPSVRLGDRWSRRSDMIGATILARRQAVVFTDSTLTLHHDRTGQRLLGSDLHGWVCEFVGVILSRLVMAPPEQVVNPRAFVREVAMNRVFHILDCLMLARTQVQEASDALHASRAWWWGDGGLMAVIGELDSRLRHISSALEHLDTAALGARLLDPRLIEQTVEAHTHLGSGHGSQAEARRGA